MLEQGVVEGTGFGWVRVSRAVLGGRPPALDANGNPTGAAAGTLVLVLRDHLLSDDGLMKQLEKTPWTFNDHGYTLGYMPFDAKATFGDERVQYVRRDIQAVDFQAWATTQVEVPDGVDATFRCDYETGHQAVIDVRTVRKGKVVTPRIKVPLDRPFAAAAAEILAELARTSPRPGPLDDRRTVHAHVAELMRHLDRDGLATVREWLAAIDAPDRSRSGTADQIEVSGDFLPGTGVVHARLSVSHRSRGILAHILTASGNTLTDDETGVAVEMAETVPAAMAGQFKGKPFDALFSTPWMHPLTARTAPRARNGRTSFRAFADNVPLVLGEPRAVDDAEIDRRLARYALEKTHDFRIEAVLAPILETLPARALSVVLARLAPGRTVDLGEHGHPGIVIGMSGWHVHIKEQPTIPMAKIRAIADAAGRTGGESQQRWALGDD